MTTDIAALRALLEEATENTYTGARNEQSIADARDEITRALPALLDRVEALEAALRPFAEAAESYDAPGYTDQSPVQTWALTGVVVVGHLRAARDVLGQAGGGVG